MRWLWYLFPFPILPWPPAVWTKKDTAEFINFIATLIVAGTAFAATQVDDPHKLPLLVTGVIAGVVALYAKTAASRLERLEKEKKELNTRARAVKIASALLEAMHRGHFRDGGEEETHKNRVTLFTCVEADNRTGSRKHLAIFARCGVHQSSTTTWPLSDDHPNECRGAAGKAWYHETTVIKRADRDWPTDEGDQEGRRQFATSQGITLEEAVALREKSRAVVAAPVMVRGRKWGILVLDSLTGEGVPPAASPKLKEFKAMFNHYAELIGRVLGETGL